MKSQHQSRPNDRDVRCPCGQLIARWTQNGVEIKCNRCRRVVCIPFNSIGNLFNRSRHALKTRMKVMYEGWTFTTRGRYFSSFGFTDANSNGRIGRTPSELTPSNVQIDMRLSKTLKNGIAVYLGADNITESRVPVSSSFPWKVSISIRKQPVETREVHMAAWRSRY